MIPTSFQEIQKQEIVLLVLIYLAISFVVIYSLCKLGARRKHNSKFLKEGPFWLERILGTTLGTYALRSFSVVFFLFFLDYILSRGRYPPPSLFLTSTASFLGLLLSRSLYHRLTEDTVPYISSRLNEHAGKKESREINDGFLIFIEAAGRSALYQGVCCIVTIITFIIFYRIFSYKLFPSFWSRLFCFVMLAGILGPLSTTVSGFIIYSQRKFSNLRNYSFMLLDDNKMVKNLGGLALHSSFIAAISAGIAVPAFYMTEMPGLISSFTIFLTICVFLFFFGPVFFIHKTTRKHKAEMLSIVDPSYEKILKEVYRSIESGFVMKESMRLAHFLLIKEVRNDVLRISEWPLTPVTYTKSIVNVTIPVFIELTLKFLL